MKRRQVAGAVVIALACGLLAFLSAFPLPVGQPSNGGAKQSTAAPTVQPIIPTPSPTVPLPSPTTYVALASPTATPSPTPTRPPVPPVDEWLAYRPPRDLQDLARRFRNPDEIPGTPTSVYPAPRAGDVRSFWVMDQERTGYSRVKARLSTVSERAYFYVDNSLSIPDSQVQASAREFDRTIYPKVVEIFGPMATPGIDGDERAYILITRLSRVAGYHSSADSFPSLVHPYSNEAEIIYVSGSGGQVGTPAFGALLAHEFQHLVRENSHRYVDSWLNEGSSELAVSVTGYRTPSSLQSFLNSPDTQLNDWTDATGRTAAHYGAAYLFLSYFTDRFGIDSLDALRRANGRGTELFDDYLARRGEGVSFDDLFAEWTVANYVDDTTVGGGRFGYEELDVNVRSLMQVGSSAKMMDDVSQYAARYYRMAPTGVLWRLTFQGQTESRLIPVDAVSGQHVWWSNRGDLADTRLTRAFDLRGLATATLEFDVWFDTEISYDYGYVAVSVDDGDSWTTLPGVHTTTLDPTGNNLGYGYTGRSGGGDTAGWVKERIDLSPFAGRQILLRFEYVTDDGYNARGVAVDDIRVPEVGFSDDAESDSGWLAEGFVRTDNRVPQRYAVHLVREGDGVEVQEIALSGANAAALELPAVAPSEKLTIVVAAMSPLSTERAPIRLALELIPNPAASPVASPRR